MYIYIYSCSATANLGPRAPHCQGSEITHTHTHTQTHHVPVGTLWTRDYDVMYDW